MRSDDGAVDHIGRALSLDQLSQALQEGVEDPKLRPAPEPAEHAVPLAVSLRQLSPLRARAGHPQHAFEEAPVVMRRPSPTPALRRQQRSDDCPLFVRHPNPLAQNRTSIQMRL